MIYQAQLLDGFDKTSKAPHCIKVQWANTFHHLHFFKAEHAREAVKRLSLAGIHVKKEPLSHARGN